MSLLLSLLCRLIAAHAHVSAILELQQLSARVACVACSLQTPRRCCTAADAIAASPCLCDGATTTYVLTEWLEAEVGAVEPAFVQNAPSILLAACRIVAPSWASG